MDMAVKKRVLLVGEFVPAGLCHSIAAAITSLGVEVDVLDVRRPHHPRRAAAAYRMPMLAVGFRRYLRRRIDHRIDGAKLDLVLVVKGAMLDAATITFIRDRLGAPVVCWNPDSPFDEAISNRGAGIPRAIPAYDAYVTWANDIAERLSPLCPRVLVIPFAWDPNLHWPTPGNGKAEGRIVLVGTATEERCQLMTRISRLRPMVFGNGWPALDGVERHPPISGHIMSGVVGEAAWNINPLRPQNARSHNMRTFEAPGCGGNQITPATQDHRRFLGSDPRTYLYQNVDELIDILQSDPSELDDRPSTLLDGHRYEDRLLELLRALEVLVQ